MSDATRNLIGAEAVRKLNGYLATGVEGLKQQGLDRVRELGIDPSGCCGTPADIRHLVDHLALWGYKA